MPTTTQIADILFKKMLGLGATNSGRQFFSEPVRGRSFVVQNQIWADSNLIPDYAPTGAGGTPITSGVVQRVEDYVLTQVVGATNSFSGVLLQDAIPFNWGSGTGYNYTIKDSTNASIPFGTSDWTLDTEAGILMFNSGIPANMPPKVSFYRYSGNKGITSSVSGYITTGQADSRYIQTGQIFEFSTTLNSGVESQIINYPQVLSQNPSSVTCTIVNNMDNLIYSFVLSSVNTGGFTINFSDYLSSTGYTLYSTVST